MRASGRLGFAGVLLAALFAMPVWGNPVLEDATAKLRARIDGTPDGGVLKLERGEYHLFAKTAVKMTLSPSNNTRGEKQVLFPIVGRKNLTIDGNGSTFIVHDQSFPFAVLNSSGITLKNFAMKTFYPPVAEFKALEITDAGTLIEFAASTCPFHCEQGGLVFETEGGATRTADRMLSLHSLERLKIKFLYAGESTASHENLPATFIRVDAEPRDGRKVFLRDRPGEIKNRVKYPFNVGERVVVNLAAERDRLSIFCQDCDDVRIENVCISRGAGMGVVVQRSANLTVRNFAVAPERGELVTTTADILQLINCCGKVLIENCEMSHSLDDAVNIHGNYLALIAAEGKRVTLQTKHQQHAGFFPYRVGDALEFVTPHERDVVATAKVTGIAPDPQDVTKVTLTLDTAIDAEKAKGTLVENVTLNPDVTIRNCHFHDFPHVRLSGRGHYLVENNVYERVDETVVGFDLADYWYESGRISDMTIRNNVATASGGYDFGLSGWEREDPKTPKIHGLVVLENNVFIKPQWRYTASGVREFIVR